MYKDHSQRVNVREGEGRSGVERARCPLPFFCFVWVRGPQIQNRGIISFIFNYNDVLQPVRKYLKRRLKPPKNMECVVYNAEGPYCREALRLFVVCPFHRPPWSKVMWPLPIKVWTSPSPTPHRQAPDFILPSPLVEEGLYTAWEK